jgi:hypothetical protein
MSDALKILNFNDALSLVKKTTDSAVYEVWIPSLDKNVKFRPLNAAQHKSIIQCALKASILPSQFNNVFYKIIKECVVDIEVEPNSFTILDKIFIAYHIRKNSIGPVVDYTLSVKNKKKQIQFQLDDAISNFKTKYREFAPQTIQSTDLEIDVKVPTLEAENATDRYIIDNNIDRIDDNNEEKINNVLTESVVYTISKFIQEIRIGSNVILFYKLTTSEKIQLLNSLDKPTFDKIYNYVVEFNKLKTLLMQNTVKSDNSTIDINVDVLTPEFFIE